MDEFDSIFFCLRTASGPVETLAHVSLSSYNLFTLYPSGTGKPTTGSFLDSDCDITQHIRIPLQGNTVEFDIPVHVLSGQTVLNRPEENDRGQNEELRRLGAKSMSANILLSWSAGAQLSSPMLTEGDLSRFSRLAGTAVVERHPERGSDQITLEGASINETRVSPDQNYRAFLAEAQTLGEECGRCVVAYARGKRIALAKNLSDLLVNIPDEYDEDDILIERVPSRSFLVRPPIRVLR
jgi:hypothetical protein